MNPNDDHFMEPHPYTEMYTMPSFQPKKKRKKNLKEIWKTSDTAGRCALVSTCCIVVLSFCIFTGALWLSTKDAPAEKTIVQTRVVTVATTEVPTSPSQAPPVVVPPTAVATSVPTAIPPTVTPVPTNTPTVPKLAVTPTPASDVANFSFDPTGGSFITNPPADFCTYYSCASTFSSGTGYVIECVDLKYLLTGGTVGSCADHGGDYRILYSH